MRALGADWLKGGRAQDPLDRPARSLAQAFARATGHKVEIGYSLTGPILVAINGISQRARRAGPMRFLRIAAGVA